jgi:hypothetical protein
MLTNISLKRAATVALALGAVSAGPASAMPAQQTSAPQATSAPQVTVVPDAVARLTPRLAHGYGESAPQAVVPRSNDQLTPRFAHGYGEHLSRVTSTASYGFTSHPRIVPSGASSNSGFHWGDAGIGAAGGLALTLLGFGGAVALTRRRPHHAAGRQVNPATTL